MELELLEIPSQKINQLNKENIYTVEDLVQYFPKDYYDFRNPKKISSIVDGENCAIVGKILNVGKSEKVVYAKIQDDSGEMLVKWFYQPYVKNKLLPGRYYIFCGKVYLNEENSFKSMIPIFYGENIHEYRKITPIYEKIKGMSEQYLQNLINKALNLIDKKDYLSLLPKAFNELKLESYYNSLLKIHRPSSREDIIKAQQRIIFNELFSFSFGLKKYQIVKNLDSEYKVNSCKCWTTLYNDLGFDLTEDQKKCLKYLYYKMKKGKTIDALVQADVGAGKTIIAFFLMAAAAENGFQSCLMAPNENLAIQHYEDLIKMFKKLEFKTAFLSSSIKGKKKENILKKIKEGSVQFIVGTHSVFQKDVEFQNLGLAVIDEQHKFGVVQREDLANKSKNKPHTISMSATPIPRTLSMILYGNSKEVITIRSLPKGRKPVKTIKITNDNEAIVFIRNEINKGHQCYIVCPMIKKSKCKNISHLESAEDSFENFKKYFKDEPHITISLINGDMKREEINEKTSKFVSGETKILVATTLVEVGINVPNATIILIKNAERFGLAQLHQLRGRVGRGSIQSYCLLQSPVKNDRKINIMCKTTDGFEIAKQDLMLRGPGDFLGVKQSGENKQVMLMLKYPKLYEKIDRINYNIYSNQKMLEKFKPYFIKNTS